MEYQIVRSLGDRRWPRNQLSRAYLFFRSFTRVSDVCAILFNSLLVSLRCYPKLFRPIAQLQMAESHLSLQRSSRGILPPCSESSWRTCLWSHKFIADESFS